MASHHRSSDLVQIKPVCTIFTISIQAFNMKIRMTVGRKIERSQYKNPSYSIPVVFHVNNYARNFREALGNKACVKPLLRPLHPRITLLTIGHFPPFK
jgi:hypothetical protein